MINLLLSFLLQASFVSPAPVQPNVLIIILDDVGKQDIDEVFTPSIDALAQNGITFDRGYSQPICAPSRYALMFGKYGQSAGSVCFGPDINTPDVSWPSLPRVFKNQGYNTAFLGKWHLGGNTLGQPWELSPTLHGYDKVFAGVPGNLGANSCGEGFDGDYNNWLRFENGSSFISTQYNTLAIRNKFAIWWKQTLGSKFAYLSFQAAHAPFHEPPVELVPHQPIGGPAYSNRRIMYEKMLISLDTVIGQLASVVSLDNTYIILIGDNGTPPDARSPQEQAGKLKTTPYEGGVLVPFIIAGPGIVKNVHTQALVNVVDILPTVAELIGVSVNTQDGISFMPTIIDPSVGVRDHVFVHNSPDKAVIQSVYKLILINGTELFFNLSTDPLEQNPIDPMNIDPLIVQDLRIKMQSYIARGL